METVQQNGRFTLFSSKFLSIYSILYAYNIIFFLDLANFIFLDLDILLFLELANFIFLDLDILLFLELDNFIFLDLAG